MVANLGTPKSPPALGIPDSAYTVDVRVIDTGTLLHLNPSLFWQPPIDGFTGLHAPIYCFLVSHGNQHVIFDLGVRTDWENYAPKIVSIITATTTVTPGSDVPSVLDGDTSGLGIRSADIGAVIWSHNHFDHVGDVSRFPPTTDLIVGPGVRGASWPGWPTNPDGTVLDSDAEGRVVREVSFEAGLKIGRFDAMDFFGDGSFYLLDAPGHAVGHLCALARTTADEPTFVFMGADACHHPGLLRPSNYLPLPSTTSLNGILTGPSQCPGEILQQLTRPDEPFFTVAPRMFPDHDAAMDTVRKIQELDAADNCLVLIAHDLSLRDKIPLFPETINGWKGSRVKTETRWLFCNDFIPASGHHENERGIEESLVSQTTLEC
ncbi:beta-lactamase-like protein [Annulohypoxylon truncatum]|uniref:beta-lactamase-like protein n=1 Tax=Annulohypoxylon truncatum TaxID=327061 RepID=UPI002007609C|nr:beta-lactamase-like protein [Annulohypoxylon truncatum]KAI1206385.1 beta-lactamase-like protein [Annulohypoxylon truncatum]